MLLTRPETSMIGQRSQTTARPVASLDGILPSPLTSRALISRAVRLVHMGDLGNKRVVGVRVSQHRADREQNYVTVSVRLEDV